MIAAWRQERDRQMAQQRKKEEEKLRKEKEARRAKAACEAKRRLAAEQKLAALAALPAAEHRRRNAQLKASRDFSDSPDETAPIAPARSCHPKLIAPVQPKAAFKPAGSYSSLTKTASQRAVSTQRQKAVGAAGSDRQAAHKRAKAQAAKRYGHSHSKAAAKFGSAMCAALTTVKHGIHHA